MTKQSIEVKRVIEMEAERARGMNQGEFQGTVMTKLGYLEAGQADLYKKYNTVIGLLIAALGSVLIKILT